MKKKLTINHGIIEELSFEEVFEKYHALLVGAANRWNKYDFDDMFQTASWGLWEAYTKYDSSSSIAFGYYAKLVILNRMRMNYRTYKKQLDYSSLDEELHLKDDSLLTLKDMIADITNYEDNAILNIRISNLDSEEIELLRYKIQGLTQKQIMKKFEISQTSVCRRLMKLKNKLVEVI